MEPSPDDDDDDDDDDNSDNNISNTNSQPKSLFFGTQFSFEPDQTVRIIIIAASRPKSVFLRRDESLAPSRKPLTSSYQPPDHMTHLGDPSCWLI